MLTTRSQHDMSYTLRIDGSTCSAGFECLTEDLEEVVGLFNEVIQEPAVQQDKVAFYKAQVCCCLLQMLLNPSTSECACVILQGSTLCSAVLGQVPLMIDLKRLLVAATLPPITHRV